jgi:integrase
VVMTDTRLKAAKPKDKPYKLFDERGLYLEIRPHGGRWWRFKYRYLGREKLLSLGVYPDVPLALARERRDDCRKLVAKGIDPSAKRKSERTARADTFEAVAREWLELFKKSWSEKTHEKKLGWLESFLFPDLGKEAIAQITAQDLLRALRRVEGRGHNETAHRVRSTAGNVMRYAVATGRAERDVSVDLRGALAPVVTTNRAAITDPKRIGDLLRAIHAYRGRGPLATEAALKLLPLIFVRPGELRGAEWSEFNLEGENPEWRIPAARMKMGEEHLVPLSRQAVAILKELQPITGGGRLVFPSLRGGHRPISENTVNVALKAMGYSGDQITGHGFRAMASTRLNEMGVPPESLSCS